MNIDDKKLEPVMVYCPFSKQTINLAPFLEIIYSDYYGFDGAAAELSKIIEELTMQGDLMANDPLEFRNCIYTLVSLKRSFVNVKTGEMV